MKIGRMHHRNDLRYSQISLDEHADLWRVVRTFVRVKDISIGSYFHIGLNHAESMSSKSSPEGRFFFEKKPPQGDVVNGLFEQLSGFAEYRTFRWGTLDAAP